MVDLTTSYLGLALKNPLIASSSPLTYALEDVLRLQEYGAAAVIMPSLFEEKLKAEESQMHRFLDNQQMGMSEADSFFPEPTQYRSYLDDYLERLAEFKKQLDIPVIASLNGVSNEGWVDYAKDLQQAGADAIELNIYYLPVDVSESATEVERRYENVIHHLLSDVTIPVGVKISSQFSAPGHFLKQIQSLGVKGASLFNRFYQPDIDIETRTIEPKIELSSSEESLLRIRWVALLRKQLQMDLAVTGGIHQASDVVKAVMCGADATCLCSVLLLHGAQYVSDLLSHLLDWMEEYEYESIEQMKGCLCLGNSDNPDALERSNYIDVLDRYSPPSSILL